MVKNSRIGDLTVSKTKERWRQTGQLKRAGEATRHYCSVESLLGVTTGAEISGIALLHSFNKYYLSPISEFYFIFFYQLGKWLLLTYDIKLDGSF